MNVKDILTQEYEKILEQTGISLRYKISLQRSFEDKMEFYANLYDEIEQAEKNDYASSVGGIIKKMQNAGIAKKDTLEYLRSQYKPNRTPFEHLIRSYEKEIEDMLSSVGFPLPKNVLTGELPINSFNAQACRTKSGGLIVLINSELFLFLYQVSRIYSNSMVIAKSSTPSEVVSNSVFDFPKACKALAECLYAYIVDRDSGNAPRYPKNSGIRDNIESHLLRGAEFFVVAHEFGHILSGHLGEEKDIKKCILDTDDLVTLNLIEKSWKEEYEADSVGLGLLSEYSLRLKNAHGSEVGKNFQPFTLGGACLFFCLDDYIISAVNILNGLEIEHKWISDHPHPKDRINALQQKLADIPDTLALYMQIAKMFDDWKPLTMEYFKQMLI